MPTINDSQEAMLLGFLHEVAHGPCGSVQPSEYEKYLRAEAERILQEIAASKLESAGAYGRTIERWWSGFYTEWVKPTARWTAGMTPAEINRIITVASRRG